MSVGTLELGGFVVKTTEHRGFSPEELTENVLDKIIHISDTAPPVIKDQAIAFRERLRPLIQHAMKQAIRSDRTTLAAKLTQAGQHDAATIIGKL